MKAKTEFITNGEAIEQAIKLNYEPPLPKLKAVDFNFDITGVGAFYINFDGQINMNLFGEWMTIHYTKELVKALDFQVNGKSSKDD